MQTLLDSAFEIPVLMEKFDGERNSPLVKPEVLNKFVEEALNILASLKRWETRIREGDDTSQLYMPRFTGLRHSTKEPCDVGSLSTFLRFP